MVDMLTCWNRIDLLLLDQGSHDRYIEHNRRKIVHVTKVAEVSRFHIIQLQIQAYFSLSREQGLTVPTDLNICLDNKYTFAYQTLRFGSPIIYASS